LSPVELEALRWKYEEMRRLRLLRARARAEAGFEEPDPSEALAALARRFPGALRELDRLPLATIEERIAALATAAADPARVAPWMRASSSFHRLARGALAAKRWLTTMSDARTADPDELRARFEAAVASLDHGDAALAWANDLAAIARPPQGRVMGLVRARVAAELGVEVAEVKRLLG